MTVGIGRGQHRSEESVACMPEQASDSGARKKMHAGEVDIDERLVERLLAAQFPQLADLPISAVPSTGTVNAIYRLGDHLLDDRPRRAIETARAWAAGAVSVGAARTAAVAAHAAARDTSAA